MVDQKQELGPGVHTEMRDGGVVRRTTIIEEGNVGAAQPTKTFKLRPGLRHTHNGQVHTEGEFELTEAQSRNWRDKFEAVDDSDFSVKDSKSTPAQDKAKLHEAVANAETGEGRDKAETDAPQGLPVPQPATAVRGVQAGRDPASQPVDPSVLDPSKQGQQTAEQRRIVDTGQAPAPAAPPPSGDQAAGQVGAQAAGSASRVPGAKAAPVKPALGDTTPQKGSPDKLG